MENKKIPFFFILIASILTLLYILGVFVFLKYLCKTLYKDQTLAAMSYSQKRFLFWCIMCYLVWNYVFFPNVKKASLCLCHEQVHWTTNVSAEEKERVAADSAVSSLHNHFNRYHRFWPDVGQRGYITGFGKASEKAFCSQAESARSVPGLQQLSSWNSSPLFLFLLMDFQITS